MGCAFTRLGLLGFNFRERAQQKNLNCQSRGTLSLRNEDLIKTQHLHVRVGPSVYGRAGLLALPTLSIPTN